MLLRLPFAAILLLQMGDWGATVNSGGLPFDANLDSKPLHEVRLSDFSMESIQ